MRTDIAQARRVVVKVGSSSLTNDGGGLAPERISALVAALGASRLGGKEVILVSSGAIAAALSPLALPKRPRDLATQQAAASVGQSALMSAYSRAFAAHDLTVGQVLLTADDMVRRAHYRNAQRTLVRLIELGVVPIVNENDTVATDEIRFGDNDRLAALVAHLVHADALILLSDVPGLLRDPKSPDQVIAEIRSQGELSSIRLARRKSTVGSGGIRTKVQAAGLATDAGVPVVLAKTGSAREVLAGQPVGTYFHVTGKRPPTRLLWLRHASAARGSVTLDEGAIRAVRDSGSSLLPAGICAVSGQFVAGDPIDLLSENGHVVARGLVNFDAEELPQLLGRSTKELAIELGPAYEREVIHRDDLVLLPSSET